MGAAKPAALVAAALALALAAGLAAATSGVAAACGEVTGEWTTIDAPGFSRGPEALSAYAVDPTRPKRLFATNGAVVARSTDGGCSFKETLDLAADEAGVLAGGPASEVLSIEVSPANPSQVYLMVAEGVTEVTRPHVIRSEDGGSTWSSGDAGLPPAGTPEDLAVTGAPGIAYLGIDLGAGAFDALYATSDGGASWEARFDFTQLRPAAGISDIEVDPAAPASLWASGTGGLYHSTDGGSSFESVEEFGGLPTGPVDIYNSGDGPVRIVGYRTQQRDLLRSDDGGRTYFRYGVPRGQTNSFAHGAVADSLVASSTRGVFAYLPASFSWVDLAAPVGGVMDLQASGLPEPVFYGHTPDALVVYRGPTAGDLPVDLTEDLIDLPLLQDPDLDVARPPKLTPGGRRVVLQAGDERAARYRLRLPERPIPLDVYFLVDTSSTMQPVIDQLAVSLAEIVNGLARRGIDAHFGLGTFRAYPDSLVPRASEPNYAYRQELDISPATEDLRRQLRTLVAEAGGTYESHLAALFQTATGEGQDIYPPGPDNDIPEGTGADFRGKSLRVVIHATDTRFGSSREGVPDPTRGPRPEIPSFEETARELSERDVLQLGLSIGTDGTGTDGTADLARMAQATGALAPAGGVDCDGDDDTDLAAGAPLVCGFSQSSLGAARLAPALVNLLEAVPQRTSVGLEVAEGVETVGEVSPQMHEGVNLQSQGDVGFDVTFSCPDSQIREATRQDVVLRAIEDGKGPARTLDEATATVVCKPAPVAPLVPKPEPGSRPSVATGPKPVQGAAPVPLTAPGSPAVELSGASSAQSSVQAQSNVHAQAAMSAEEQRQPQTAFVHAYHAQQDELQMSAYTERDGGASPVVTLAAGMALTVAAYGVVAARLKRRHVPAHVAR